MKKIAWLLILLASPALADINVTPGVGKTVHTDQAGGVEYQYIKIADGASGGTSSATVVSGNLSVQVNASTMAVVGLAGNAALGTVNIVSTNTLNTLNTSPTVNIVSTNTLNVSAVLAAPTVNVVSTNTLNVLSIAPSLNIVSTGTLAVGLPSALNTLTVTAGTGTFTTVQPSALNSMTVTPGTGTWVSALQSLTVTPGTGTMTVSGSLTELNPTVNIVSTATFAIAVADAFGSTRTVGYQLGLSTVPTSPQLRVTSTTIPSSSQDGSSVTIMGSNVGQVSVTGIPWGLIKSTYSATISSSVTSAGATQAFISSAPANQYTYLCGCVFTNTTATNGDVILESPVGQANQLAEGGGRITIGAPANHVPSGIYPGPVCSPFYRSASASNIYIYQNIAASTQAVFVRCTYFQGP